MPVLSAVEASLAATTTATASVITAALLAPADSDPSALDLVTIEFRDRFLCMLLLVIVNEGKAGLLIFNLLCYLHPALAGTDLGEDFLELGLVHVVRDVPDEKTHADVVSSSKFKLY